MINRTMYVGDDMVSSDPQAGMPPRALRDRVAYRSPPPRLGEHSAEILAEAGYSDAEINRLAATGVTLTESPRLMTSFGFLARGMRRYPSPTAVQEA